MPTRNFGPLTRYMYIMPQSSYNIIFARSKSNDFHTQLYNLSRTHTHTHARVLRHFILALIISSNSFRLYMRRSHAFGHLIFFIRSIPEMFAIFSGTTLDINIVVLFIYMYALRPCDILSSTPRIYIYMYVYNLCAQSYIYSYVIIRSRSLYTYYIISYTYNNNIVYVISIFVIYLFYLLYEFEGRKTLSRCIRAYYNIIMYILLYYAYSARSSSSRLAVCADGDGILYAIRIIYINRYK